MGKAGHSRQWALHTLASLERRLGNTAAATLADERIETYGAVFFGYANDPYKDSDEPDRFGDSRTSAHAAVRALLNVRWGWRSSEAHRLH